MKRPPIIVDLVARISRSRTGARSAKTRLAVSFASGAVAHLDPLDARDRTFGEVLESLRDSQQPAYVEINTRTGRITSLLLPQPYKVVAIRQPVAGGDLELEFDRSHAIHFLRRSHERFGEFRTLLEESQLKGRSVLVTDSLDNAGIVDVRPAQTAGRRRQ